MTTDQNSPERNQNQNSASEKPNSATQQQPFHQQPHQERKRYRGGGKGWNRDRDVLYEKAVKLAQSGRVEFLDNGVYNVIGDHGTYIVALDHTGKLSCNCPGFIQKGICSHVTAVSLVTRNRHRR